MSRSRSMPERFRRDAVLPADSTHSSGSGFGSAWRLLAMVYLVLSRVLSDVWSLGSR